MLTVQAMSDDGDIPRQKVANLREARAHVRTLQLALWRGLTAEVVDEEGEVIAYYERGRWTEE